MVKIVCLLAILAMGLGACSDAPRGAKNTSPTPHVAPTYPDPYADAIEDPEIPIFKMSKADTPTWPSLRSDVGGLPIPRGWKLIQRKSKGYLLDETYQAPPGVTYDQALAWYLIRFPEGKSWGGWTYCHGLSGSGDAQYYPEPENWAWRNARNIEHLIQIGLWGSLDKGPIRVNLYRSEFGEACMV